MGRIKLGVIISVCFVLLGFTMARRVCAEVMEWEVTGGVYHMITSPVLPQDPDPQVSLVDNLGAYDVIQWRFFRWNPVDSRYVELKTPDWDPPRHDFDFGRGYWIISKDSTNVDIQGGPAGVDQIELKGMLGQKLWNQIGSIYLQDFTIGMFPNCNLWVTPKSGGISFQLNDPLNPYTHVTLKEYAGGSSYTDIGDEPGEMLETGKGYWLKNIWNEDVLLFFDPAGLLSTSPANSTNFPSQDFFARVTQQDDPPDPPPGIESTSSGSSSSGSGSGGCFIATAAYRDYDHPKVQILREFRDQYLLSNSLGRIFVGIYYRYSPTLAKFIVNRDSVKALIRFTLMPIVGISALIFKMDVYGIFIVLAFPILMGFFLLMESGGGGGRCKPKFSIKSEEGERKR
jgi:hypothetical protein